MLLNYAASRRLPTGPTAGDPAAATAEIPSRACLAIGVHCRASRGHYVMDAANVLKDLPFIELLDSNLAGQQY